MRASPALKLGVALSLLVHVAVMLWHGWRLPEEHEPVRIQARLLAAAPAPAEHPAAAPKPKPEAARPPPRRAPGQQDAPVAQLPDTPPIAPDAQSPPVDASAPVAEQSAPAASQSAPVAAQSTPVAQSAAAASEATPGVKDRTNLSEWPSQGHVVFDAFYGNMELPAGTAEHSWSHDEQRYAASMAIRSSGLLRLAYRYDAVQETSGWVDHNRLLVGRYTETVNKRHYDSQFDLVRGVVHQDRNGDKRDVEAKGVALDILSLLHFLGGQPRDAEAFDIFVVSPRATVSRVTVLQKPAQEIDLPVGAVRARQFIAEAHGGDLRIEVWLASNWRNAPVRIYIEDRKQDLKLDLKASQVEIEGIVLARRVEPTPASRE